MCINGIAGVNIFCYDQDSYGFVCPHCLFLPFAVVAMIFSVSDVFSALGAQDVVSLGQKASAHERHGALLAVETVVVPLALLKGDVFASSKTYKPQVRVKDTR